MPNILIADDHDLVSETIAAFLSQQDDFHVSTASNVEDCLSMLAGDISYDMAIFDFNMPKMNGIDGIKEALNRFPTIKFVLMSGIATPHEARGAMEAGAMGYFPKSLSPETMVNAIRFVLSGEKYFPAELTFEVETDTKVQDFRGLSPKEIQTLRSLCAGNSNKEIAIEFDIQEVTVKLHVKNILSKLNAKNRTHAVVIAKDEGFV